MEDSLIKTLLDVKATDHRKIQEEIKSRLEKQGYEVKLEKKSGRSEKAKLMCLPKRATTQWALKLTTPR